MIAVRLYIVRGTSPTLVGREMSREGGQVTINVAPPKWPFPCERTFARSELAFADGPRELEPEESLEVERT